MIHKIIGFEIPTRYANFCISVLAFVMLMFANLLPASAAVVAIQSGMLKALGEPAAINSTPSPNLLLVRHGGGGRGAHRGGGRGRGAYRGRGGGRRAYRGRGRGRGAYRGRGGGPSIYFSIPSYPRYYSYRPNYGRCEYWGRRCAANWGYGNSDYYGCMRYQGCR